MPFVIDVGFLTLFLLRLVLFILLLLINLFLLVFLEIGSICPTVCLECQCQNEVEVFILVNVN